MERLDPRKSIAVSFGGLPTDLEIHACLGPRSRGFSGSGGVSRQIAAHTREPIEDLLSRPSKKFRGELVRFGYHLACEAMEQAGAPCRTGDVDLRLELCIDLVEMLHAASLVVDDIEDGSEVRRGKPSLHQIYGMPVALNAGNWLYFWPLKRVREVAGEDARFELSIYRLCHDVLVRAHFGQALDVGTAMDLLPRVQVEETCIASLELKSGALVALAMQLGACVAGADMQLICKLGEAGYGLGLALQMYDDAGNFAADGGEVLLGPGLVKQMEDLRLKRPSWLWAVAARLSVDDREYADFVSAVRALPDVERINAWAMRKDWIRTARAEASDHAARIAEEFERNWRGLPALDRMRGFLKRLGRAYGGIEPTRGA